MSARAEERVMCFVYTQPKPGHETEYHEWYDDRHLQDVAKVPGVVSAKRYELVEAATAGATPPASFLAIYEIDGDPVEFVKELRRRFGTDAMPASSALDQASISMSFWRTRDPG